MTLFVSDGSRRSMPGMDPDIVAELKQFLLDTLLDGLKTSSRKVGAADGTRKQGIADKNVIVSIKGNTAPGVPRRMDDGQGDAAEGNFIIVFQFPARGRRVFGIQTPGGGTFGNLTEHGGVKGMNEDGSAGNLMHSLIGTDMIHMAMGVDNIFDGQVGFGQSMQNSISFFAGINNHRLQCFLTAQNKTVCLDRPDSQCFYNHIFLLGIQLTDDGWQMADDR
jgi:hypothetical protein